MTFVNYKEINCKKSKVLQVFSGINTIEKFAELNLPIASYQQRNETRLGHCDIKREMKEGRLLPKVSVIIEIDLSKLR